MAVLPATSDRRRRSSSRRRGARGRDEADKDRRELADRTTREVDALVSEHHARMHGRQHDGLAAIYARYSTRFQDSVADQVRAVLEDAERQNLLVPRELVFFDMAVRGFKRQRAGLDALNAALRRKAAGTLLLFSTSRLFRKQYRTLEFVDHVHKGLGVRCRFVKSGVDTADKEKWEMLLSVQAMVDQFTVSVNVANIRSDHEGLLAQQLVFGTISFGYRGDPIPGAFTRRNKPRCRIAIDEEAADIVRRVFHWYVVEKWSIAEIYQTLTADENVPLPPRSTTGQWTHQAVKNLLINTRYRGLWKYGVTESTYLPEQDYVRQKVRATPLREIQIEDLRIVPDELWYAAQERLAGEQDHGRRPGSSDPVRQPGALNGLLYCPEHNKRLYVGGANGRVMLCPRCQNLPASQRRLYSQLNRKLALEATCRALANLIRADTDLARNAVAVCQQEAQRLQQPNLSELPKLDEQVAQCERSMQFVIKNLGDDEAFSKKQLDELQRERDAAKAAIANIERLRKQAISVPTEADVQQQIDELGGILVAANTADEESARLLRRVLQLLTGGRIELFQMGERRPKRGYLQGRFRCDLIKHLVCQATGLSHFEPADAGVDVVVDYRAESNTAALALRAVELDRSGLLRKEIGRELGVSKSRVTALLKQGYALAGEPFQDGRKSRSSLVKKQGAAPRYVEIADEVHELASTGMLLVDIAQQLGVDRDVVTKAQQHWHRVRGLPIPDGRTRRKSLPRKTRNRSRNEQSSDQENGTE